MTERRRDRPASAPAASILLILLVGAGGCSDLLESVPPRPAAIDDPAVDETPYPRLAAAPARPRLSYSLEQRRTIVEGLVADRDNARHQGDALRAETGRPPLPAVPPLPPAPLPKASPPADPAADLAIAYVEESLARDADDGSLGDFLDRLERLPPGIDAAAAQAGIAAVQPPAAATASPPRLPLRVIFVPGSAELGPAAQDILRAAGAMLRDLPGPVVVKGAGAGAGPAPGLGMERAQRVAAALVAAGLDAGRISFETGGEMGGDSDAVIVYQPGDGPG